MRKFIEPNTAICPVRSPRLASSSKRSTTKRGCTRPSAMCRRSSSSRMAGLVNEEGSAHSYWGGRPPQPPHFSAFPPEWIYFGERAAPAPGPFRPLSRRSGCVPAVPYPPLRYSQSGRHQPARATIFCRTAITPLTHCLTPRVHFMVCDIPLKHLTLALNFPYRKIHSPLEQRHWNSQIGWEFLSPITGPTDPRCEAAAWDYTQKRR